MSKVRMLEAQVVKTLLYGCVTWLPLQKRCYVLYAKLCTIHHGLLLRVSIHNRFL